MRESGSCGQGCDLLRFTVRVRCLRTSVRFPAASKEGQQVLDYNELKDQGGLDVWPGFDELPYAKTLEGDPVQSGRFRLLADLVSAR